MNDVTYVKEEPASIQQLLKVFGHQGGSNKIRKLNEQHEKQTSLGRILSDSFAADNESDAEEEFEPSCDGVVKDAIKTFDMPYEEYLETTAQTSSDHPVNLPEFKTHKFKFMTPILSNLLNSSVLPELVSADNPYGIQEAVFKNLLRHHRKQSQYKLQHIKRNRLRYLFNCMNSYVDVFLSGCKVGDMESVRYLYALHAANHVSKTVNSDVEKSQGFTKPRVLYICGLKSNAHDFICHLMQLLSFKKEDPMYDKFMEEYELPEDEADKQKASFHKTDKSFDFVETFSGNQDDAFKIGLRYYKKRLHFYSSFYKSDIIVASPLGLNLMLQDNEYDFMSSIEVILIDRLDVIKFQNWRFLLDLIEKINLPLSKWRDADLNLLRVSTIDGHVKLYRQTIAVSCTQHSIFNALFRRFENKRGFIKLAYKPTNDVVLLGSQLKVQQLFIKVAAATVKDCEAELMKYFIKNMLSSLQGIGGVLIVLGDYTHFLRITKDLQFANFEYLPCHESCTPKQMLFARQQFQAGKTPAIITTSRLLFFKRYVIKGTSKVFFVVPPEYPDIYREAFKMFDLSKKNSVVTLYTQYNANQLEPIMDQEKLRRLLSASDTKVTQFH